MTRAETALADIARRREVAQAATPGPWYAASYPAHWRGGETTNPDEWIVDSEPGLVTGNVAVWHNQAATAAHIAANDPAHVLGVLDDAEAVLRRHRDTGRGSCTWCTCARDFPIVIEWPCPDAVRVLDLYAPEPTP